MPSSKIFIIRYKFSLALALVIILLSLIPGSNIPDRHVLRWPHFDKIFHFLMYATLSFSLFLEYRCDKSRIARRLLIALGILAFSLLLEVLQQLFHTLGRSADLKDFLANLAGILFAFLVISFFDFIRS